MRFARRHVAPICQAISPEEAGRRGLEIDNSRYERVIIHCKPVKNSYGADLNECDIVVKMSRAAIAILFTQTNLLIALPYTVTFGFDRDDRFRGARPQRAMAWRIGSSKLERGRDKAAD